MRPRILIRRVGVNPSTPWAVACPLCTDWPNVSRYWPAAAGVDTHAAAIRLATLHAASHHPSPLVGWLRSAFLAAPKSRRVDR